MSEKKRSKRATRKIPAKMGAPTKLDDARTKQICNAIRIGAYVETAAAHAGISKVTFYKWLKKGQRDSEVNPPIKSIERTFHEEITEAMADAELLALKTIHESAQGYQVVKEKYEVVVDENGNRIEKLVSRETSFRRDWQAAGWWCERRFPDKWGRRERVDLTSSDGSMTGGPKVTIYMPRRDLVPEVVRSGGNGDDPDGNGHRRAESRGPAERT